MNKMSIIIISAGLELWDELTVPALDGLCKFGDPGDELIVVDNGGLRRGTVNFDTMVPYGTAVNAAARLATGDRLLILNNDIHVRGLYREHVGAFPFEGKTVYFDKHGGYIEGWLISIDMGLWEMLNGFDERLRNCWEDVDLSHRARLLGFDYHQINPPIDHYGYRSLHRYGAGHREDSRAGKKICALKEERMNLIFAPDSRG